MSNLAVIRFENPQLDEYIREINNNKIGVKDAIVTGYEKLEEQRGKLFSRSFIISSLGFSAWCLTSAVISAYGAQQAGEEFLADGGGSIIGHTSEWWPRVIGSTAASLLCPYILRRKGMFHDIARQYKQKIYQIIEDTPGEREIIRGLVEAAFEATEECRVNLPVIGDDKAVIQPPQNEEAADDEEVVIDQLV